MTTYGNRFDRATKQEVVVLMRELLARRQDYFIYRQGVPGRKDSELFSYLREIDILRRAVELLQ